MLTALLVIFSIVSKMAFSSYDKEGFLKISGTSFLINIDLVILAAEKAAFSPFDRCFFLAEGAH